MEYSDSFAGHNMHAKVEGDGIRTTLTLSIWGASKVTAEVFMLSRLNGPSMVGEFLQFAEFVSDKWAVVGWGDNVAEFIRGIDDAGTN